MKFISATQIGKKLCISYQKVNEVLASKNLYDKVTKRPTEDAIENGLAEIKTTVSKFHGRIVEFNVWDYDNIKIYFDIPTEVEKVSRFKKPSEALSRFCGAFADFGHMLEIEVRTPKKGISDEAQRAVVESYFGESALLRGVQLLHRFLHPDEAEYAKKITLPLANELYKAAKKIDALRAESNLLVIKAVLSWLCQKAC